MSGHCEHCFGDCIPRGDWDHWSKARAVAADGLAEPSSAWTDGNCPACAERERIADYVLRECDGFDPVGSLWMADLAERIAKGEQ